MKQISEYLYRRGKRRIPHFRMRTPSRVLRANPDFRLETVKSLGTSDEHEAVKRARRILPALEEEFDAAQANPPKIFARDEPRPTGHLDDASIAAVAKFYTSSVLWSDQDARSKGMDDEDFDALGEKLQEQRKTFGRILAQGKTLQLLPAFQQLLLFRGVKYLPAADEAQKASYQFAEAVVQTLDLQLQRQQGNVVDVQHAIPETRDPFTVAFPGGQATKTTGGSWEAVFDAWRDYVLNRPVTTSIASEIPWKELRGFAEGVGRRLPADITPEDMTAFVDAMVARGLKVPTVNGRVHKIRQIFKIAAGRHLLDSNPATNTLGRKQSGLGYVRVKSADQAGAGDA